MQPRGREALLRKHRWIVFVLPLAVYLLFGALEPTGATPDAPEKPGGAMLGLSIPYSAYPVLYTIKIAMTLAAVAWVWPGYREFPFRVTPLSALVGVVGVVVWVALAEWQIEPRLLRPLGLGWLIETGARPAYNPLAELSDRPPAAWAFLAVRFVGLAAVVPLAEEFFLRGFVMRFVMAAEWWKLPIGKVNAAALAAGVIVPVLAHPGEILAAAVWFSLVTWLMVRTRSLWDCVAAHAVTNLLLGIYVLAWGRWHLW